MRFRLLCEELSLAPVSTDRREDMACPGGDSGSDSLRARPEALLLRSRSREHVLAHTAFRRCGLSTLQGAVHRQIKPRTFLLGELRPGGDTLLGTPGSGETRRRLDHARSVLA